ncbi:MAG: glycogen synthase GlgA [Gallionella sp.]
MAAMKILFVTSEAAPLIKTGGLADVSGALPAALCKLGVDVRVLLPGYPVVMSKCSNFEVVATFTYLTGFPTSRLLSGKMDNGVPLLVLDCPGLYQRDGGPYQDTQGRDWSDNAKRFALLSKVAAILGGRATPLAWHPNLVHCNDWQSGLTPAYLHYKSGAAASVITIHNLAFQGNFPRSNVHTLGLPASSYSIQGLEFHGMMSFLKAGMFYADHITTVSPNYAREIQQDELGFGMQGLLNDRTAQLTGILNGIDEDEWDPASDPHLSKNYDSKNFKGKALNKQALQKRMGLEEDASIPLLGVVSRFTHQKGLDLLLEIAPRLMEIPVQLVMLGSGDVAMQNAAQNLAQRYPGKIAVMVGFNEALSHQIEAGADMFMMPSRFEPCGLNQMYSQRYGTPPLVHDTGGLADSVVDCNPTTLADGSASGFVFHGMTADNLHHTILRAVAVYKNNKEWLTLCKNCMAKDFSWETSAKAYLDVYNKVLGR